MENKGFRHLIKNKKGQTSVEYIMLFAVVFLFVTTVIKNQALQNFLGPSGTLFRSVKGVIEHSYQFAIDGKVPVQPSYQREDHLSYQGESETRFFGPQGPYPGP